MRPIPQTVLTIEQANAILDFFQRETGVSSESDSELRMEVLHDLLDEKDFFLHKKGGLYVYSRIVRDADDGRKRVLYDHVYPHDQEGWVRDPDEFYEEDRFMPIDSDWAPELE